jgi:hypothetical protein
LKEYRRLLKNVWTPTLNPDFAPSGMETDSILVIMCFKGVKTFDDVQKLKIIALGLPQKHS